MTKRIGFQKTGSKALADFGQTWVGYVADKFVINQWETEEIAMLTVPMESYTSIDAYELCDFARDDFPRFAELLQHMSARDAEILYCFAVLRMRATDLSVLFGKAGHRAEEDLHKAAHKLAGIIAFGVSPEIERIDTILQRHTLDRFGKHSLSACLWEYSRTRDFQQLARLLGHRGFRQHMLRVFKQLHASDDREAELLAGWILWLVDQSDPNGKGWKKPKRSAHIRKLGPTSFYARSADLLPPVMRQGGQRMRADRVTISRKMKFYLRGMEPKP